MGGSSCMFNGRGSAQNIKHIQIVVESGTVLKTLFQYIQRKITFVAKLASIEKYFYIVLDNQIVYNLYRYQKNYCLGKPTEPTQNKMRNIWVHKTKKYNNITLGIKFEAHLLNFPTKTPIDRSP